MLVRIYHPLCHLAKLSILYHPPYSLMNLSNQVNQMRTHTLTTSILSFISIFFFTVPSNANQIHQPISEILRNPHFFLHKVSFFKIEAQKFQETQLLFSGPLVLAGFLCFIASSISSAGGIGGGGIFIPILIIIAGLDLKTASSLSAFMVTGGSAANVVCNLCSKMTLMDYDIALLSEPCMLLGVSVGVICNLVFPEWLITVLFDVFLAWSTLKTCKSGVVFWKSESEEMRKNGFGEVEERTGVEESESLKSLEEPLVGDGDNCKLRVPWFKLCVLLLVWLSFFSLYLLRGNKYGEVWLLAVLSSFMVKI